MNWLVLPTLVIALLMFILGQRIMRRRTTTRSKVSTLFLFFLLGIPGFLLCLYYLHWFDNALWFYAFRSLPHTELTAAGTGLFAGALAELIKDPQPAARLFLGATLVLWISAPHSKPLLSPLPGQRLSDRWDRDVCIQSTPSSCGAASAATIFRDLGLSLSEQEIAKECFTYIGGTENWYIARAFRKRGCTVTYRQEAGLPPDLQLPAIAGVCIGGAGHFIAIVNKENGIYVTGDPLVGREEIPAHEITGRFNFTGFFMEIQKDTQPTI